MKKTHDYIHHYRGYWSDGGRCRIRIYREELRAPVVICSQLPDNHNTSVTNMAEYLVAEVMEEHALPTPLVWVEHYPEHEGEIGEYSLVRFSSWDVRKVRLGGVYVLLIAPRVSFCRGNIDALGKRLHPSLQRFRGTSLGWAILRCGRAPSVRRPGSRYP